MFFHSSFVESVSVKETEWIVHDKRRSHHRTHKNSNACHCIGEKMANRQVPFSIIIFIIIIIVIYYEEKKLCVKNSKWRSWSLCAIVSHLIKFNSNLWRFSLRGISNFFSVFHSFSPISLSPNTTNGDSIASSLSAMLRIDVARVFLFVFQLHVHMKNWFVELIAIWV